MFISLPKKKIVLETHLKQKSLKTQLNVRNRNNRMSINKNRPFSVRGVGVAIIKVHYMYD